jgi:hypothetical protein
LTKLKRFEIGSLAKNYELALLNGFFLPARNIFGIVASTGREAIVPISVVIFLSCLFFLILIKIFY